MNKAVFLDRDGVINVDNSYVYKINDFKFCDGIFEALKNFQNQGYLLIIVTNQSGIGRGYYKEEDFLYLSSWMNDKFIEKGIKITDIFYCPHAPEEACACRKPNTKMFENAIKEYDIDVDNSWMIGDKKSDIEAGKKAKINNTIFINDSICKDAKYSVKEILDTISIIKK